MLDTRSFLQRVLPQDGGFYYSNYGTNKLHQSPPLASFDELVDRIEQHAKLKENIYFATGVYGKTRTSDAVKGKKALYLDLDCGPTKGFATQAEAITRLAGFCSQSGVPMPNLINTSGYGIHCYWSFKDPIQISQWLPMAERLKELCVEFNFPADGAITADSARIMRVPGTKNWKDPAHPRDCRVIKADPEDFDAAELALRIGSIISAGVPLALAEQADNDDLGANLYGERQYFAADMIEQCAVLRHTRDTGGKGQPGMLWHKVLHLLAYTEDGHDFIHQMSDQHDEYNRTRVEQRFAYSMQRKAQLAPTLCRTFEGYLPSKCKGCPYNGGIKTPLVLGKPQDSMLPMGWKMNKEGIHKPIKFDSQGKATDWTRVIPYQFTDVELYKTQHGNGVQFTAHNGPRKHVVFVLGVHLAGDPRTLGTSLMEANVMLTDNETQEFRRVMTAWMRRMEMIREAKPAPLTGLGWMKTTDKVGFATGAKIFMEDGTTSPVSGVDLTIAREYSPKGDGAKWRDAANGVLADGCHAMQAAVLTAFAAPLLNFTGVQGVMLSLFSRESGTGKSSALQVAQAVWGDPRRGVNALNDTTNSVTKKFGMLRNLPAYWDEIRMRDEVQGFIRMLFQLGQGKEKQRLTSNAKMQEMGTWATITTVATNEPVLDHVDAIAGNTNAGRLRVFEIDVPVRSLPDLTVSRKVRDLEDNYGHVGEDYAVWLSHNHAKLDALVPRMQQQVAKDLNATNDERFWVALVAVLLVAAHIAHQRRYITIDPASFKDWIYTQFRSQRGEVVKQFLPPSQRAISFVIDYIEKFRDQMIVVDHVTTRSQKSFGTVHHVPEMREFLGMIAVKDRKLRLKKAPFNEWVYMVKRDSPSSILEQLYKLGAHDTKSSMAISASTASITRVAAIDIDLNHPALTSILTEPEDNDEGNNAEPGSGDDGHGA